jgi:hypothetical protein
MKQSGMPEDTAEKIFEGFSQESSKCFLQKGMGVSKKNSAGSDNNRSHSALLITYINQHKLVSTLEQ